MTKLFTLIPLMLLLSACSFVRITPAGDNIAVLQPNEVTNCTNNGSLTVNVVNKVVNVNRDAEKVATELRTLARNRAAGRGDTDTIVAAGPPQGGQQTFNVYKCRR